MDTLPPFLETARVWLQVHWMQLPVALLFLLVGLLIAGRIARLADSCGDILCRPPVATADYPALRRSLLERVKVAYDDAGITIPFPQREVLLRQTEAG